MSDNKYCYNCNKYKPYYTKGYIKFDKCDIGLCGVSRKTVDKHDGCEYFGYKCYSRADRKAAALSALTENINILAELKQILEEEDEELLDQFLVNFKNAKKKGR